MPTVLTPASDASEVREIARSLRGALSDLLPAIVAPIAEEARRHGLDPVLAAALQRLEHADVVATVGSDEIDPEDHRRLIARGMLDADGALTPQAREALDAMREAEDAALVAYVSRLDHARRLRMAGALHLLSDDLG